MGKSYFNYDECEAAMCLWEESIQRQHMRDDELFGWLAGGEGAARARGMCIELAKDIEYSYNVAKAFGFDDCFDWDFVPMWADLAMEISAFSDLTEPWLRYIGYKAAEMAEERWG